MMMSSMSNQSSFNAGKDGDIGLVSRDYSPTTEHRKEHVVPGDADKAYSFLNSVGVSERDAMAVNLPRLRRRVDWRLIPFLGLCYTMAWLDKGLLNYANIMGLSKNLKLKGNDFSNVNTFFFVALTLAELPTGLILNKIPAKKWMGINVILWGAATCSVAGATGFKSLLSTRILVAIFEAGIAPCLLLLVSQWYTKSEQSLRFCLWYTGLGTGQILGSLSSYGFQFVTEKSFQNWRIMFITLGGCTILLGIIVLVFLPENPMKSKFLSNVEKAALLNHISVNQTGVSNTHLVWSQIVEALLDVQTYWLMAIMVLFTIPSAITTSYGATLLANFGYSTKQAAVLGTGNGAISICAALISGYGVRYTSNRWAWIVAVQAPGIIGGCLYSFVAKSNKSAVLAGLYLSNTSTASIPHVYQWAAANVAGHTKRAFVTGLLTAAFGAGSAIGPQLFQARDAPLYQPARIGVLSAICIGCFLVVTLAIYYRLVNMMREKKQSLDSISVTDEQKWGNLTDHQNLAFRYVV